MLATTRLPSNFKIVIKLGWILNFIFFTFLWLNSGGWDPRVYFEALNITYTTLQYTRGSTLRVDFWNRCTVPGISMDITYLTIYHNFCPGIPAMNRHQLPVLPVIICIFFWKWLKLKPLLSPLWTGTPDLLHLHLCEHAMKAMDLENHPTYSANHLFEFQLSHQICRLGFCRDCSACYPTPDRYLWKNYRTIKQWWFSNIDFWFLHISSSHAGCENSWLILAPWSRLSDPGFPH